MNSGLINRANAAQVAELNNLRLNSNSSIQNQLNSIIINNNNKSSSQPQMHLSNANNFYTYSNSDASIDKIDGLCSQLNGHHLNGNHHLINNLTGNLINNNNDSYLDENQQIQSYHQEIQQNHSKFNDEFNQQDCNQQHACALNCNSKFTSSNCSSSQCTSSNCTNSILQDHNSFFSINSNSNLMNNLSTNRTPSYQLTNQSSINFQNDKNSNYANAQIVQQQLKNHSKYISSNYQFNSAAAKLKDTIDQLNIVALKNLNSKDSKPDNLVPEWSNDYTLKCKKYLLDTNCCTNHLDSQLTRNWEKFVKDDQTYYFNPITRQIVHSSLNGQSPEKANCTLIEINNKQDSDKSSNLVETNGQQNDNLDRHNNEGVLVPANPFLTERIPDWLYIYSRASIELDGKLKWPMFNEEELTFYLVMMKRLYLEEAHEIVSKYDLLKISIQEEIISRERQSSDYEKSANLYDNLKDNDDKSIEQYTNNHYSNITDLENDFKNDLNRV